MQVRPTLPAIGEPFQGGTYAGLFHVNGVLHALIVADKVAGEKADQAWHDDGPIDVPAAISFIDGRANTGAMAEAKSGLAHWALSLDIGGFKDWYLPSRDELELLYRNLKPTTDRNYVHRHGENPSSSPAGYPYTAEAPVQTSVQAFHAGGVQAFESAWYWSSTQYSRDYAWLQYFGDGDQGGLDKSYEGRARAVRRFKVE